MMLSAGQPVEPQRFPVGRRSTMLVDHQRGGRLLGVEIWYPAAADSHERTSYELFPGVAFSAAGAQHAPAVCNGQFPLVLFSHGRTGVRIAYSLACEALAARGAIVVSADHPGDALFDWLTGTQTDDATNERNRVADAHLVLGALIGGGEQIDAEVTSAIDPSRIAVAGHSYGAYTALATAAGTDLVHPHPAVRAVIGFQPYTRTMSDDLLARLAVPTLLVASLADQVTPVSTDVERPFATIGSALPSPVPVWRLDLAEAGHQAISDISLYAELADQVPNLPDIVRGYLASQLPPSADAVVRPWRDRVRVQVAVAWEFLQATLSDDAAAGQRAAASAESAADVHLVWR